MPSVGLSIPRRVGRELPKLVMFCGAHSDYSMTEYVMRMCRIAYNAVQGRQSTLGPAIASISARCASEIRNRSEVQLC